MFEREIANKINELRDKYPIIQVTGPRQSGKTTLVKMLFPEYEYRNLEIPDQRLLAQSDPRAFLQLGSGQRMIIDEIQEVPELVSYMQVEVDEQQISSQFVITGSQNFKISQTVSQSLAGRVAVFELLPLSYRELRENGCTLGISDLLYRGGFPAIYARQIEPADFYRDFVNTYVTRDVRMIKNIGDLSKFMRFLELLAGRIGQVLNKSSLSNDLGISVKTVEQWISVLEASYLVFRLQPYFENVRKRLTKNPKIYFTDTGLASYLLGIDSPEELSKHFIYGSLFENFVILEKLKRIYNSRSNERLYFWRDSKGVEIDLIVDKGLQKELMEIKSGRTFHPDFVKSLESVAPLLEKRYEVEKIVIYGGDEKFVHKGVQVLPWASL